MLKESAYGLGCTTWEVVRYVVIPYTRVGIVGGVMLGLGRALGETMAVTFVIGNAHRLSASLMAPSNTISSALANEFTEADRRTLPVVADRARPDPVRDDLHRAGDRQVDAGAARAEDRAMRDIARSPRYRRRKLVNLLSRDRRHRCQRDRRRRADADHVDPAVQGRQQYRRRVVHRDDAAAGQRRRPAQRHRRQPDPDHRRRRRRDADRRPGRDLPGRIRPLQPRSRSRPASSTTSCSAPPRSSSACSSTR